MFDCINNDTVSNGNDQVSQFDYRYLTVNDHNQQWRLLNVTSTFRVVEDQFYGVVIQVVFVLCCGSWLYLIRSADWQSRCISRVQ